MSDQWTQARHDGHAWTETVDRMRNGQVEAAKAAARSEQQRLAIVADHRAREVSRKAATPAPTSEKTAAAVDSVSVNGKTLSVTQAARWMSKF